MLVALALAAAGAAHAETEPEAPAATWPTPMIGVLSGISGDPNVGVAAFEDLIGQPVLIHSKFVQSIPDVDTSWFLLETPQWWIDSATRRWLNADENRVITYGIAPWPLDEEVDGADPLQKAADGEFNEHYKTFGANLLQLYETHLEHDNSFIIRYGWEWDGDWFHWGVDLDIDRAKLFAQAFRHFVDSVRSVYTKDNLFFSWNPTNRPPDLMSDAFLEASWPGDDYVDIISPNNYDQVGNWKPWCESRTDTACRKGWAVAAAHRFKAFADERGMKPLAFDEYGLWSEAGVTYVDNEEYIVAMWDFIKDPDNRVLYHSYFEATHNQWDSRLGNPKHANALAAYKAHAVGATINPLLAGSLPDPAGPEPGSD